MPDYGAMASELLNQPVSSADARGLFSALFDLLRPEYTKEPAVTDVPAGTVGKVPQNQIDPLMAGTGAAVDVASMLTPAGAAKAAVIPALGMAARRGSLAMDEASRLARAASQGYTIDAFKGLFPYDYNTTPVRNGLGKIIANADAVPQELRVIDSPGGPHAGFFSSDPEVANKFATAVTSEGAVMPAKLKFDNPLVIDAGGKPAAAFQFESVAREHGTIDEFKEFKAAFDGQHDGVILKNTKDEGTVYVPRNPSQIRSRFAAFDPANLGKGDALGGVAAAISGSSLLPNYGTDGR